MTSVFQLGSFLIWGRIQFPGLDGSTVFSSKRNNNCLTQSKERIAECWKQRNLPVFPHYLALHLSKCNLLLFHTSV